MSAGSKDPTPRQIIELLSFIYTFFLKKYVYVSLTMSAGSKDPTPRQIIYFTFKCNQVYYVATKKSLVCFCDNWLGKDNRI